MASEENVSLISRIILANIQDQLNWIKSMTTETGVLHIMYNPKSSPLTLFFRRCLRAAAQV
jgi:hypothetical protein